MELSDSVIEVAVRELPPEIFAISGNEIIEKLKSRRDGLNGYAVEFSHLLSKQAMVMGSEDEEWFVIERLDDKQTLVKMYKINDDGKKGKKLFERIFANDFTKEIHIYGLGGDDCFEVLGKTNKGMQVFVSAGKGDDTLNNTATANKVKEQKIVYVDREYSEVKKVGEKTIIELIEKK